jgi:proton glutamate symport protein
MGQTARILLALAAGIFFGLALRAGGEPWLLSFGGSLRPLGQLWLHALQMTIVPLIFCLMANGIGAVTRMAGTGRVITLTIVLLIALLLLASTTGVLISYALMAVWPVAASGRIFLEGVNALPAAPSIIEQLLDFIPLNPVAAAAQSAMTPLIVFAAIFGAAATRIAADASEALFRTLNAVAETMLVIVRWVLSIAPFGVFFLALDAVLHVGLGFAASLAQLVLMLSAALAAGLLIITLVGSWGSGLGIPRFARAAFAPRAVAASTQSSVACLPALIRAAEHDLEVPSSLVAAVMPLAVSTFRFGNVLGGIVSGLIGAYLCGIHPGAG